MVNLEAKFNEKSSIALSSGETGNTKNEEISQSGTKNILDKLKKK